MSTTDVRTSTAAFDVVAILRADTFEQMFVGAHPLKLAARVEAKVAEHPLETGAVIVDHRVILPNEVELSLFMESENYRSVYMQIRAAFNAGLLLIVQTKATSFQSLQIVSMPHDEDPSTFDAVTMSLRLKEVRFVTAEYGTLPARAVANKSQQSTKKKGEQQTTMVTNEAQKRKTSTLYRILN